MTPWYKRIFKAENVTTTNLTAQELANLHDFTPQRTTNVTATTAMRVSAVYAGVQLIAGAISTLPLPIYKRTKDGRERVEHDYWWLLNEQPHEDLSAAVFWEYMIAAKLFYGDAFAEILRPHYNSNKASGFIPLHPQTVTPFRDNKKLFYKVTEDGRDRVISPADMIHIPSLGFDGLSSPSAITFAARQAVALALSANEHNEKFFDNGARPDFALKTPGNLTKEQSDLLRTTWAQKHAGVKNSHVPAVLTGGLEIQELTLSAQDAQLLETCNFQIEEIARILGVPPHMIGHTEKTTSWGSGVENMGRGFVKFTLSRDLVKIEQELNRKLWPTREKYFVEFNVAGLERGDLKSENEALRVALGRAGEPAWMTVNEVRRIKNLPPVEGGDVIWKPEDAKQSTDSQPA